jgi:hypothetical protein
MEQEPKRDQLMKKARGRKSHTTVFLRRRCEVLIRYLSIVQSLIEIE